MGDPSLIIPTENNGFKEVASINLLWRIQFVEEVTWEAEEDMKNRYPHLLESRENASQGTNFLLSTI